MYGRSEKYYKAELHSSVDRAMFNNRATEESHVLKIRKIYVYVEEQNMLYIMHLVHCLHNRFYAVHQVPFLHNTYYIYILHLTIEHF